MDILECVETSASKPRLNVSSRPPLTADRRTRHEGITTQPLSQHGEPCRWGMDKRGNSGDQAPAAVHSLRSRQGRHGTEAEADSTPPPPSKRPQVIAERSMCSCGGLGDYAHR